VRDTITAAVRLIVFGASGGCGSQLVRQAVAHGHQVTAVVRSATQYEPPDGVAVVRGDVLNAGFVASVIPGHDAVASCVGIKYVHPWARRQSPDDFISRATANIIAAMKAAGLRRVSAISAGGVGDSRHTRNAVIRFLIATSNVGVGYADLDRVEQILRASGLDWQAVRPVRLSGGAGTGRVRRTDNFPASATIPRADVAAFMLSELERPQFSERTPMIAAGGL
jgi:putative NADH-flavin reductase